MMGSLRRGYWSTWGERLVALALIATVLGLVGAWVTQYAASDGGLPLADRLSYTIVDPSWLPPGATPQFPIWGVHYFGDMWYHIAFGEVQTPYIIPARPAQYPPIAIYMFKLWGLFGYPVALAIMTLLNVALLSAFAWRAMFATPRARRAIVIIALILLTGPMVVTLDRGGHQYIALGVMAWALWNYTRGRPWTAVILMVIAISLKSYFALFLIYPLVRGHVKFVLSTGTATILINGLLFFTFPGRATVSFAGFFTSSTQFSNAANFDNIYNGTSLTSGIFHVITLISGREVGGEVFVQFERLLSVPGLMWLGLVAVLAASRRVPFWVSITLALSTAAMSIPAAWPYNYASASLAALYFGLKGSDPFPVRERRWFDRISVLRADRKLSGREAVTLRWIIALTIVVALAPQFYQLSGPSGDTIRGYYLVAPAVTFLGGLGVMAWWLATLSRQTRTPSVTRQ